MANLMKKGGDNLLNGVILGAIAGVLVAGSSIPWLQSVVNSVINAIPTQYLSWAGTFQKEVVFGLIGAIAGYIIDRS